MNSSESAEELVKISLQGFEVVARITGVGASHIAELIYNKLKEKKTTKGKTRLMNLLKSGSELKIFSLQDKEQLKKFHRVANEYGVLYTAIMPKKDKSGFIDIMLRAEDAAKVNWIIEKFKLAAVDVASIKSEVEKEKMEEMLEDAEKRGIKVKTYEQSLAEDLLSSSEDKIEEENPKMAETVKSPLSEPSLKNNQNLGVTSKDKRPSVRYLLNKIISDMRKNNLSEDEKENLKAGKEIIDINIDTKKVKKVSVDEHGFLKIKRSKLSSKKKER